MDLHVGVVLDVLRINGRTFYAMLRDARSRHIALWGGNPTDARWLRDRLALLDVQADIVGAVDLAGGALAGSHMVVLLHDGYLAAADWLESQGYRAGADYRWVKRYGNENLRTRYMYDPMLGFNSLGDEATPGFFRFGTEPGPGVPRVVVLGGSTADPGAFVGTSWPEMLADIMAADGVEAAVYDGAVTGYTSAQELGKLLRDVPALRPDVVVLYSGINNNHLVAGLPYLTDYQARLGHTLSGGDLPTVNLGRLEPWRGLEHPREGFDKAAWWLGHMHLAHEYGRELGASVHCVLQPNLMTKPPERLLSDEREYLLNRSFMGRPGLTPQGYREIALGLCRTVEAEQPSYWLHDLTHVFDGVEEPVYEDAIHVNDHGNRLVAEAVWDIIRDDVH